jgi:hypothetical protein
VSLVARITALAQAVGADIKAISANVMDLAGTRQMTGPLDNKGQTATTFSGGKFDLNGTGDYYIASLNSGAQITEFGTVREGARRLVRFYSGILLTHSDTLVLPGGANIVTQNDDIALFVSRGGGSWRTAFYSRADGTPVKVTVASVAGRTGTVVLAKGDVGLGNVENTADADKPISAAQRADFQSAGLNPLSAPNVLNDADVVPYAGISRTTSGTANRPQGISGSMLTMAFSTPGGATAAAIQNAQIYIHSNQKLLFRFNNQAVATWREVLATDNPTATGTLTAPTIKTAALDNTTIVSPNGSAGTPSMRVSGTAGTLTCTMAIQGYGFNTVDYAPSIIGTRSSGSVGVHGAMGIGRSAFAIIGAGSDGTDYRQMARIDLYSEAVPTSTSSPGQVRILTTPAGSVNPSLAMTIKSDGGVDVVGSGSYGGSLAAAGPVKPGQYTLTTLPSAAAFNGYEIDVTNATVAPAGPKRCRSNGTNWIILNTTTIVS